MKKTHSLIGSIISLALHLILFTGIWWVIHLPNPQKENEEFATISMEMVTALLEQPQVAVASEPLQEQEPDEFKEEPEPIPDPIVKPVIKPKPVEKPKEKPKPKPIEKQKPKEKPKAQVKTEKAPVKALETDSIAKQGVVAKIIPNAAQGSTLQTNKVSAENVGNTQSDSNRNDINAYITKLQRILGQKAKNAYPARERLMRKEGIVTLSFSISSSGKVMNVKIKKSSGNLNLDKTAIKVAESTSMNSPPPQGFPNSLSVPVNFYLEN